MNWTSKAVDNRNKLMGIMRYSISCDLPGFFEAREWCWNKFGPGIEHEHWANHARYTGIDIPWCWDCAKFMGKPITKGKIYLQNEAQMVEFSLRWG
jgi:hypothetical protein